MLDHAIQIGQPHPTIGHVGNDYLSFYFLYGAASLRYQFRTVYQSFSGAPSEVHIVAEEDHPLMQLQGHV